MAGVSYWVYLTIDTGGPNTHDIWGRNHTSNTASMWREAGADLTEMDGMDAATASYVLTQAIKEIASRPSKYRAMEPENGWGTYDSCLGFLREIRDACDEHPNAALRVSH